MQTSHKSSLTNLPSPVDFMLSMKNILNSLSFHLNLTDTDSS